MEKKLLRSATNKKLGGVCAGLAEYFGIDTTIVRLGYILLTFITGLIPLLLVYLIACAIIPQKN